MEVIEYVIDDFQDRVPHITLHHYSQKWCDQSNTGLYTYIKNIVKLYLFYFFIPGLRRPNTKTRRHPSANISTSVCHIYLCLPSQTRRCPERHYQQSFWSSSSNRRIHFTSQRNTGKLKKSPVKKKTFIYTYHRSYNKIFL